MPSGQEQNESRSEVIAIERVESAPVQVAPSIQEAIGSMTTLRKFISRAMNQGLKKAEAKAKKNKRELSRTQRTELEIDYGTIPGVSKPFLKQPGAEKILSWLNLRPVYNHRETDLGNGHLECICDVRLLSKSTGVEIFAGPTCSCSTMEDKFRYRWVETGTQPDKERAAEMVRAGSGRWKDDWDNVNGKNTRVGKHWEERVEIPNAHDKRNNVRQICDKRAVVKATRNLTGMSEIFVEDPSEWDIYEDGASPSPSEVPTGKKTVMDDAAQPQAGRVPTVYLRFVEGGFCLIAGHLEGMEQFLSDTLAEKVVVNGRDAYKLDASYASDVADWCETQNVVYRELTDSDKPVAASGVPATPGEAQPVVGTPAGVGAENASVTAEGTITVTVGKIKGPVKAKKTGKTFHFVEIDGKDYAIWDKAITEALACAQGMVAVLDVETGKFPKVNRIRSVNKVEFDEDNLPVRTPNTLPGERLFG